ncbi:MAG: hypothetical protein EXR60_05200 [Dehalococcoidia bacterium]|nr:hypothetical protein [Dehalococcoidia bacterium]
MKYSEMVTIKPGLRFKTVSGLVVETTGATPLHVESSKVYVHEVKVAEGPWKGEKYRHNLDMAQALS